ncbi:hypothetical protein CKO09_10830 [Chromatium weissei]|nr:hypothetical protein [Chromatium weissei]
MSKFVSISVIICTWNRSDLLKVTLDSLHNQSGCEKLNIEVVIVDNNSSDDTRLIIEQAALNWKLGQLCYAFEPRQGKQFALNTGIKVSTHSVLAFSDDDVVFSTDWLLKISQLFQDKTIDLAGGKTLLIWPNTGQPSWFDSRMSAIVAGVNLGDQKLDPPPAQYAPAGTNLIVKRDLFNRVGLFSEEHFRHMDYEFGMRCHRAGVRIVYDPNLVVYAPVASEILTKRYFRRWSFKAGIDHNYQESITDIALFLRVPRWVYRQIFVDFFYLVTHFWQTEKSEFFHRELRIWRHFGTVVSCWRAQLTPQHYLKWVERYSQKKNNLY